jgi:A/G-specific adenine glycosylase
LSARNKSSFTPLLLQWNNRINTRSMPWKGEKDPYKVWLSEVILQQTRVEQGLSYYEKFITEFPTVQQLAAAKDEKVFKCWEGLGYYSRCKNLLSAARTVVNELGGRFPDTYEGLLALKGVGPYTAAAIASFVYQLPHAVLDGNVFRVLARYFGLAIPIDSTEGKKQFSQLANALLDPKQPGMFNQAIMDFGAVVCKPRQPLCTACPLAVHCRARIDGTVTSLPVKEKNLQKKERWLYYIIIEYRGQTWIRKRTGRDIWENLYEFLLVERAAPADTTQLARWKELSDLLGKTPFNLLSVSQVYRQHLTHQQLTGQFIRIGLKKSPGEPEGYERVPMARLADYPFPRFITRYLRAKEQPLQLF